MQRDTAPEDFYRAPYAASEQARGWFDVLKSEPENPATWQALVTLATGRIITLSDFQVLDSAIDYCDRHLASAQLSDELRAQARVAHFGMLVFRNPAHPDIQGVLKHCHSVAESNVALQTRLGAVNYLTLYHIWCGRLLAAQRLNSSMLAARRDTNEPCALLMSHSISSMVHRLFLDYAQCEHEIDQGLALARETDIHLWDSHFHMQRAFLALSRNNTEAGGEALTEMNACTELHHFLDRSGYQFCQAWRFSLLGELQQARSCAEESMRLAERSGAHFPRAVTHMGMAQACLQGGEKAKALYHFSRVKRLGRPMQSDYVPFVGALARAQLALNLGLKRRARKLLRYGMKLGRERNYFNFPWWQPQTMAALCQEALDADIETDYVRDLIRRRRLLPVRPVKDVRAWEWPLRIEVLSGPRIILEDQPLTLSGKGRELLWVLCVLGVNGRAVLRHRIEDLLWPEMEGDKARQVLDTTLHRLRKRLGSETMIRAHHGSISLAPGLVSVDLWWVMESLQRQDLAHESLLPLIRSLTDMAAVAEQGWPVGLPTRRLQRLLAYRLLEPAMQQALGRERWLHCLDEAVQIFPDAESLWLATITDHLDMGLVNEAHQRLEEYQEVAVREGFHPSPALLRLEKRLHASRLA